MSRLSNDRVLGAYPWRNLGDLFREFSNSPVESLWHDNGYRSWKYTYAQVGLAARHFAVRLSENNIHKGDKVIFWSENCPEWVVAFWGCLLTGVVVVPIDYRTSPHFLRFAIRMIQLIEAHAGKLSEELMHRLESSDSCRELLRRVPAQELKMRTHEIYRNLSDWLLEKTQARVPEVACLA